MKFFPFLNAKTGPKGSKSSFSNANFLSLLKAAAGHFASFWIGKISIIFPLKPLVLQKGINMRASFPSKNFTFSQRSVVFGSNPFSCEGSSSPILHEVKKLTVAAVQKTCLEYSLQLSSASLCPRMHSRSYVIGSRSALQTPSRLSIFPAPVSASLIHLSELKFALAQLLITCAKLRLLK